MIKFFLNKLLGPKRIRTGKCKQCGQCCRNITFKLKEEFVRTEAEWEEITKKNKRYKHFEISGTDEDEILLFKCKSLSSENKCTHYHFRSMFCRKYPFVNSKFFGTNDQTLDNCGYSIGLSKNFIDYLK